MRPQGGGFQQGKRGGEEPIRLPPPKPVQYFTDKGNANTKLLDQDADDWAKRFEGIPSTQLRRFYEHVLGLKRSLELETENGGSEDADAVFERLKPEFKLLKAKAAYTHGRADSKTKQTYYALLEFVVNHTSSVNTRKDFEVFCRHFEAVVAYHRFYRKEKD